MVKSKKFAPNKWFDDLSVPNKKNKYYDEYKKFFLKKLKQENINIIFVVGFDKERYLDDIFSSNNCIVKKKLNQLTKKINLNKCNF